MIAAIFAKANPKPTGAAAHKPKEGSNSTPTGGGVPKRSKAAENPAKREAAATYNVSPKRTEKAALVLNADPALAEKVRRGDVPLAKAYGEISRARKLGKIERAAKTEGNTEAPHHRFAGIPRRRRPPATSRST